jgi:hypothetical protein
MKATAFIVGPEDGPGATLKQLARQIGFEAVYPFRSVLDAERQSLATPLIYFLFPAADGLRKLKRSAEQIRGSEAERIRFAPMVYFSESPSLETAKACINMGFDDIITLPVALSRVEERLDRQLERPLTYYETASYFGPERRNRIGPDDGHAERGTGGPFRRTEFIRTSAGINLIQHDAQIEV